MTSEKYSFDYEVYDDISSLGQEDQTLLLNAQQAAGNAYAPYSRFSVGAAAQLGNGELVTGSNQENASFPAGLCAEGTVLAVAAVRFPGVPIRNLAISYKSGENSDHPIAPCGICRQQLQEFSVRTDSQIRLILGGMTGKVIVVENASSLLPFSFRF